MLNQIKTILERMNQEDPNVIELKSILNQFMDQNKVYMLREKKSGKFLSFYTDYTNDEFSNGTIYKLWVDGEDPIWTTKSLLTAAYNKYVSTPYYNSTYETTTHNYQAEELEIVDNYGKVYNAKPLTVRTINKVSKFYKGYDMLVASHGNEDLYAMYCCYSVLTECREFVKKHDKIMEYTLDELYRERKKLIAQKSEKLKQKKSFKAIQKKIDAVNQAIKMAGGK